MAAMVRPCNRFFRFLYHAASHTLEGPAISKQLMDKLGFIAFELALVGAFWWYFKLVPELGFTLVGAVLLSGLAPDRFSRLASGLALLGVAAFFYFYAGANQLAMILGAFGLVLTVYGGVSAAKSARPASE